MTDETPLLGEVRTWLERGGYILEMEVARRVRRYTNLISQGDMYIDPVTGKERESDVYAVLYTMNFEDSESHGLVLDIECKKTDAPWVCFIGEGWGNGPWTATHFLDLETPCPQCERLIEGYWELHRRAPKAYGLSEKRAAGTQDHASAAIQQVASAHRGLHADVYTADDWHGEGNEMSYVGAAIVVTTSPLILCSLTEEGEIALEEADRVSIMAKVAKPVSDEEGLGVLVVTLDGLDSLLADLEAVVVSAAAARGQEGE